ncbi:MAG: 4Fe-4S binding protein [Desulfobacteraceae bacterium]|nr:4Fe-4S binding protein [Desulfobacteraceae bacterium]
MRITTVRRISQIFFFALFIWFCIASTFGISFWQLRGWPVNWFLQLDPLVALGTLLTTRTIYAGLIWALATIALTLLLGRFFCGWVCPFGSLHHFVGYLGSRNRTIKDRVAANRPLGAQKIKYYVLTALLSATAGSLLISLADSARWAPAWIIGALVISLFGLTAASVASRRSNSLLTFFFSLLALWTAAGYLLKIDGPVASSLMTGLLDPIPLMHRSVNLVLLPFADSSVHIASNAQRHYDGAWLIGLIFLSAVFLNLVVPRFYCRIVCPLGALYGVLGRFALWRVGKKNSECRDCRLCDSRCEGACDPGRVIRVPECVLCMNCLYTCKDDVIGYNTFRSEQGEIVSPNLSRRGFVVASLSGIAAIPLLRLDGKLGANYDPALVRPPGSLTEADFLNRCIKCGQCARVCPTNVIQPDEWQRGLEGIWTPKLNFRTGTSGCQLNCTACGQICPTAAIRPLSIDEKLGRGSFEHTGPIRIGTAFVDRGRCLPWAMDKPCIVCQENCPVSPKAITVREIFTPLQTGNLDIAKVSPRLVVLGTAPLRNGRYGTGDYYLFVDNPARTRVRISGNTESSIALQSELPAGSSPETLKKAEIQVRLQIPQVDPERCIGCGICEHECPVSGLRAIRVSAEGETRHKNHSLLLK